MTEAGGAVPAVSLRGLRQRFGATLALDGVDLDLRAGETCALVGENGAGKSTLARVLAGLHGGYEGEVCLAGRRVQLATPAIASAQGIALVHQELSLVPELRVFENVFLGREPRGRLPGLLDFGAMRQRARALFEELGVSLSVEEKVAWLGPGERQLVEIAKGLAGNPRLLLLDEPTSSLSVRETRELLALVGRLRARGVALVYVSHRLDEVFAVADRIGVLRDGRLVADRPRRDWNEESLVRAMVGRHLEARPARVRDPGEACVLRAEGLGRRGCFEDVAFSLRRGEVLALAGLVGAGRSDVLRALFGLAPAERGALWIGGKRLRMRRPVEAIRRRVALVPEDRFHEGLVPGLSVRENAALAALPRLSGLQWMRSKQERREVAEISRRVGLAAGAAEVPVRRLSGGNQQKVVVARALLTRPEVLLLDEPTRGIDVAAKAEIHALVDALARGGTAILLVSSDLPELLELADRILVMRSGRVVAELSHAEATEERVVAAAAGLAAGGPVSA